MVVLAHSLVEQMGGQWSLVAYYRSILMCSVLCQFYFTLAEPIHFEHRLCFTLSSMISVIFSLTLNTH